MLVLFLQKRGVKSRNGGNYTKGFGVSWGLDTKWFLVHRLYLNFKQQHNSGMFDCSDAATTKQQRTGVTHRRHLYE